MITYTPTAGDRAAFQMMDQWLAAKADGPLLPTPGSPMAGDDRSLPGAPLSETAWHGLNQALDNLHAFRTLLIEVKRLHTYAPYPLLRAALENSARSVWVLMPDARAERQTRTLRIAYDDLDQLGRFRNLFPEGPSQLQIEPKQERLMELARSLGIDPAAVRKRPSPGPIVEDVSPRILPDQDPGAAMVWRACSAFSHADAWVNEMMTERVEHSRQGNIRVFEEAARMDLVMPFFKTAFGMTAEARKLYEQRRTSPTGGP